MDPIGLTPIGTIENGKDGPEIVLAPAYRAGLEGLSAHGHVLVLWWMDRCDNPRDRNTLAAAKPYRKGPERLGVFAMRSPERPNPIAVSTVAIRLAPSRQGRGFGTEALSAMTRFCFACTELRHLRAEVDVRNAASRRMLEKCGYRRECPVLHGKMVSVRCDFCVYGIRSGTAT